MGATRNDLIESTPLSGGNADYVETLYEQFLADPASVRAGWREYFSRLAVGGRAAKLRIARSRTASPSARACCARCRAADLRPQRTDDCEAGCGVAPDPGLRESRPPGREHRSARPARAPVRAVLDLDYFGLTDADLDTEFFTGSRVDEVPRRAKLREILAQLRHIYCGSIGAEFAHVSNTEERLWLQDEFQAAGCTTGSRPTSSATSSGS